MSIARTQTNRLPLPRKTVTAGAIGNFVEWYDAIIFAYAAAAIGGVFYGGASPAVQLVAAFSTFAVTYLVRPLGGIILGIIGDRIGRKKILVFTIILMGAGTTCIGLLPGYDTLGVLAPILLILCRIVQGIGAGGELMAAVTYVMEHVPRERRGTGVSLIQFGTGIAYPAAFTFSFVLMQFGGDGWFNEVGWRWLFLSSAPLALVALYIRSSLTESPVFDSVKQEGQDHKNPGREALRVHKKRMLAILLFGLAFMGNSILFLAYVPTYLRGRSDVSFTDVSVITLIAFVLFAVSIPFWGLVLDKVNRHVSRIVLTAAFTIALIPCFWLFAQSSVVSIAVGMSILAILLGALYPMFPLVAAEAMPPAVRTTGSNTAYNIGVAVIMGPMVVIALQLAEWWGPVAPAFYGTILGVISIIAGVIWSKELDPHVDTPVTSPELELTLAD
ncbi:MAG: MFS transporter [Micrococcaceae bacterium]